MLYFVANISCYPGFVQNLEVLKCPWIWKQKFKALNILEFVKKCLNSSCFSLWIFYEIIWPSKTDILLNWSWFCMFISDKTVWNSLKLRFEQFNVTLYWFLTPSVQCLVLEFADAWSWMSLKSPWIWLSLICTNPGYRLQIKYFIKALS
jgi:hypothetical protein